MSDISLLLKSKEYQEAKIKYEKMYFKLFGNYCRYSNDSVKEYNTAQMREYFSNKKIKAEIIEKSFNRSGSEILTKKTVSKSFFDIWHEDPDMLEYLDIDFQCDLNKVPKTTFNLFKGFNHFNDLEIKDVDLNPVFNHIKSLVNYDESHFEYVLNWLAFKIQNPHKLPDTSLIFISEEGVGKDLFYTLLTQVFGEQYCGITDKLDKIVGNFNSLLGGKLLFCINETNPVESQSRIDNITNIITAKTVLIEAKYKNPVKCNNFCVFIFFSNNIFAFPVNSGSRRPVIFQSSDKYLPINYGVEKSVKHFKNLDDTFNDRNFQYAFLRFLQQRDITAWNPKDFKKSKLHDILIESSIEPIYFWMAQVVKDNINKDTYKENSTVLLDSLNEFLKVNSYSYCYKRKKFAAEIMNKFGAIQIKSSNIYYELDIKKVKKILETKCKIKFDNNDDNEYKFAKSANSIDEDIDSEITDNSIVDIKDNKIKELEQRNNELQKKNDELKEELLKHSNDYKIGKSLYTKNSDLDYGIEPINFEKEFMELQNKYDEILKIKSELEKKLLKYEPENIITNDSNLNLIDFKKLINREQIEEKELINDTNKMVSAELSSDEEEAEYELNKNLRLVKKKKFKEQKPKQKKVKEPINIDKEIILNDKNESDLDKELEDIITKPVKSKAKYKQAKVKKVQELNNDVCEFMNLVNQSAEYDMFLRKK